MKIQGGHGPSLPPLPTLMIKEKIYYSHVLLHPKQKSETTPNSILYGLKYQSDRVMSV